MTSTRNSPRAQSGGERKTSRFSCAWDDFVVQHLGPTGRRDAYWVHHLMVDGVHQRKGIASALIKALFRKAKTENAAVAIACTTRTNLKIYQAFGFELKGRKDFTTPWGEWTGWMLFIEPSAMHV
ncbi:hypothetical protein OE88DRAFT_1665981 [Heliocybe sulcata]|uniref:N-acetyltransferase domain-containing protein n=1 Tax=Heliocybe sulcata TaxID=5364 RepID=A0A5C3MPS1_9AGAM|nr:hypothetical protein OE88DRAFT_1665981 [Heliocybe sulcata]